jgi:hypothetical protein
MRWILVALVLVGCGESGAVPSDFDGGATGGSPGTGGELASGGSTGGAAGSLGGAPGTGGTAGATAAQCFVPLAQVSGNATGSVSLIPVAAEPAQTQMSCNTTYRAGVSQAFEIIGGQVTTGSAGGTPWTETGYTIVPYGGTCSAAITYQADAGKCGTAMMHATLTVAPM